jgi:hypothetical protein
MQRHPRRLAILAGSFGFFVLLSAATQVPKFPGGVFKATYGTNSLALDFDSTGALNVSVDNQAYGQSTCPEGNACPSSASYLWSFLDNRLSFTAVGTDDCSPRRDPLLGLVWTRG